MPIAEIPFEQLLEAAATKWIEVATVAPLVGLLTVTLANEQGERMTNIQ